MARFYYLTPVLGGPGAPRYPVTDRRQLIGRSEKAEIALLEPTVSREHGAVWRRGNLVYLEDLGSKHGTFVNSKRVDTVTLKAGDIIVFGLSQVLRLEATDNAVAQPAPQPPLGAEHTVSIVEPLPNDYQKGGDDSDHDTDLGVEFDAPHAARTSTGTPDSGPHEELVDRLADQLARVRKLAAVGAQCATQLPPLVQRLIDAVGRGDGAAVELRAVANELRELVRYAQLDKPKLMRTNLAEVVYRATSELDQLVRERGVNLTVRVAREIEVLSDGPTLQAAVGELMRNAIEVTAVGGEVIVVATTAESGDVSFSVTDQGAGLLAEPVERLFRPFVTLRADRAAVGLGLFEAKQALDMLGSRLTLRKLPEGGTMAVIRLRGH